MSEEVHYTTLKYRFTTEKNGGGIEFSLAYGILPSALQCVYEKHIQCVKTIKITSLCMYSLVCIAVTDILPTGQQK